MLPTLAEFLSGDFDRSYVDHSDFSSLYMRKPHVRYVELDGKMVKLFNVLDIAALEAINPGNGAFTNLIEQLDHEWDGPLFVESVLAERFASALLKMGFIPVNVKENWGGFPHHFIKNIEKNAELPK